MPSDENRCVLTLRLKTEPFQEHIIEKRFKIAEHLYNSLVALELRKYRNFKRQREYKDLLDKINNTPKERRKSLYTQRRTMLKKMGFNEYSFKNDITNMQKHFVEHIATHVAHRIASDVWRAFDKVLYGNGQAVHFKKEAA